MRKTHLISALAALLAITLNGTATAQNCAQVYGGSDQDKLIQNIRACAQDVRSARFNQFTAYLNPENCRIQIHTGQVDFYNKGTLQLIECMGRYGWKIPFTSCDINQ